MATIHPFYEMHRGAMEAAMRQRLDLAEPMLRALPQLSDTNRIRQEVMAEFEIVVTQLPYVAGDASCMRGAPLDRRHRVDVRSTRILMRDYYAELARGTGRAEALRGEAPAEARAALCPSTSLGSFHSRG